MVSDWRLFLITRSLAPFSSVFLLCPLPRSLDCLLSLRCSDRAQVVFSVLTFLLNFIPNIGSMIAIVMPIPIILVDDTLSTTAKLIAIVIPTMVQGFVGT